MNFFNNFAAAAKQAFDSTSNEVEYRAKQLDQVRHNTFGSAGKDSWEQKVLDTVDTATSNSVVGVADAGSSLAGDLVGKATNNPSLGAAAGLLIGAVIPGPGNTNFATKKQWLAEARRLKNTGLSAPDVAKQVGEFSPKPGQRYSIHNSSKNGVVAVDMEARLARGNKRTNMERTQSLGIGDTEMPRNTTSKTKKAENGVGPGMELHHRNSLIQNTPFYDGLSDKEAREFTSWTRKQGWDLGNTDGNTNIPLKISDHKGVHAWMRENGIEGARGPQRRLTEGFKGMSIDDRKYAFRNYMGYVQGGVDEHMASTLGDVTVSPKHTAAQARNLKIVNKQNEVESLKNSLGTIPSGPRAGQRLPHNRVTLGNQIINDLTK